jgi:hypothetical protein
VTSPNAINYGPEDYAGSDYDHDNDDDYEDDERYDYDDYDDYDDHYCNYWYCFCYYYG